MNSSVAEGIVLSSAPGVWDGDLRQPGRSLPVAHERSGSTRRLWGSRRGAWPGTRGVATSARGFTCASTSRISGNGRQTQNLLPGPEGRSSSAFHRSASNPASAPQGTAPPGESTLRTARSAAARVCQAAVPGHAAPLADVRPRSSPAPAGPRSPPTRPDELEQQQQVTSPIDRIDPGCALCDGAEWNHSYR
jgi:hypothetical protein